jgi:catechol 2,3-dioxygenase-like lactoylglutathione lyase family enzyme
MALSFSSSVLFVKDIRTSTQFYTHLLDQEIEFDFDMNILFKSKLSLWQIIPEHEIYPLADRHKESNAFEIYFETDNIDEFAQKIKEANVRLLHNVKTEPWGQRTIRFFDPDDHLIETGEAMPVFVGRIYHETGSLEKTSAITGVSAEKITLLLGKK